MDKMVGGWRDGLILGGWVVKGWMNDGYIEMIGQ